MENEPGMDLFELLRFSTEVQEGRECAEGSCLVAWKVREFENEELAGRHLNANELFLGAGFVWYMRGRTELNPHLKSSDLSFFGLQVSEAISLGLKANSTGSVHLWGCAAEV
ncbi:hypothetical protein PanWU01x14_064560 [Parasponia andersonii]|uniref:Uncharacterized protein n=1 Tax=Parasponia andersonii TaxID=3476 RepID=A0A2P5DHC8_PARAD|nr:hypothetical protein PanWU01x14_064560 [Parasponia andersonii]